MIFGNEQRGGVPAVKHKSRKVGEDREAFRLEAALRSPALRLLGEERDRDPVIGRDNEVRRIMEMILLPREESDLFY